MGLGGYLTWTAAIREISERIEDGVKILTCEGDGKKVTKLVRSPVFENNPHVYKHGDGPEAFPLFLNNPQANYCETDTPIKAHHKGDMHIIERICSFYGIENPELKCELHFSKYEISKVKKMADGIGDKFVTIEPHSKTNYTVNRAYPFEKWQKVVDALSKHIQVVQIGLESSPLLENVIDFRGKTSFREATLLIGESEMFLSTEGGLVHAATAVDTKSLVVITGYQTEKMVAYPQNININIANHGPCGLKIPCKDCQKDAESHNEQEIIDKAQKFLL